ncbi:hypothetical protein ACLOJK_014948 [Asimina triloba]
MERLRALRVYHKIELYCGCDEDGGLDSEIAVRTYDRWLTINGPDQQVLWTPDFVDILLPMEVLELASVTDLETTLADHDVDDNGD